MKEKENKEEKFKRILPKRLKNFVVACDRLAKLGNTYIYNYTEEDKDEILKIIDVEVGFIKKRFNENNNTNYTDINRK